ncbi:unnamed protein product [Parnassius apollo]|uniref:(apollo) hypothetical protein n=1 Tax=Parnassius apollo TaxID=110799 RepID=A0A8S3W7E9_PARAO|nr:unnamed protein product [Parnassius apollo]
MCSNRTRKILQLLQPIPDDEQLNSQTLRLVSIETVIREERCSSPLTKEQLQFFENHANEENFQYCLRELSRESPVSMLSREDSPSVLHSRESSHSLLNSQENDPYETDADSSSNWSPSPRVRKNPRLTVISSTSDSSESNVDENVNNKRKSRKRLRDQKNWKREIAKTKRLAGESNDTCDTCDKFISLLKHETNPEEREKIEKRRKEHIEDADKSQRRKNSSNGQFLISQCVWLQVRKQKDGILYYKTSFHDEEFSEINLKKNTRQNLILSNSLPQAHENIRPISIAKYKDLVTLTQWIADPELKKFYIDLPHGNQPDIIEESENPDLSY